MPRAIAYARVSSRDQNPQLQLDALNAHGYDVIFHEKISGGRDDRPEFKKALAAVEEGDTFLFWKSDRFGRSAAHVLTVVKDLRARGVKVVCLWPSMLFISHNLVVVRYVSDMIAVMHSGRIVEFGPAEAVLADPQHPYTRELLASAPYPGSHVPSRAGSDPNPSQVADVEPADPHHPPSGCRFHPPARSARQSCRSRDLSRARPGKCGRGSACTTLPATSVQNRGCLST
ncbi:oligopeptide/dipeptide ABC transporter ATP-binding protein [Nonomuraea africana]|uniref:oligopeptide/dipeptide ABC transporter ATP-binding protein n=1 Tax=Nonomuraea africana TaxID=46171 RepID=UPI0033EE71AC